MESPETWVHLFGEGGLPVALGWLAWSASRIASRVGQYLDKSSAHMKSEEAYLARIAAATERPPATPPLASSPYPAA